MNRVALIYDRELWMGGVETHLLSLVKRIKSEQYTFFIISPISENFQQKAEDFGAKIIPIQRYKPLDLSNVVKMAHILRSEKIDLVHAHSPTAAIQGRLAAKIAGIPSIVTVHSPAIQYYGERQTIKARSGRKIYITLDRFLNYTMTSALVYVSNQVFSLYLSEHWTPIDRSFVVQNGIDLGPYRSNPDRIKLRATFKIAPDLPVITYVGRLSNEKGVDTLLEAAATLKNVYQSKFKVWLIGTGEQEQELRSMVNDLNLQEDVDFLGQHEQVTDFLLASDCFVLPSRQEAMSIAIIEAMAAGLPCVVTDVGDNAQIIHDGQQGFVISQDSIDSLANILHKLILDADLRQRLGTSAQLKAQDFSDVTMAEQIQQLYEQLI
jgi:glycosyltransferase involved in cell wall biosynthesis